MESNFSVKLQLDTEHSQVKFCYYLCKPCLGGFNIFKKVIIFERDKTLESFTEFLKTLPRNRQIAILRSVYLKVEAGTAVTDDFLDAMSYEEKAYFTQKVIVIGRCTAD